MDHSLDEVIRQSEQIIAHSRQLRAKTRELIAISRKLAEQTNEIIGGGRRNRPMAIPRRDQLCHLIQAEQDPDKFGKLVIELNDFLEKREIRLKKKWAQDPLGLKREDE